MFKVQQGTGGGSSYHDGSLMQQNGDSGQIQYPRQQQQQHFVILEPRAVPPVQQQRAQLQYTSSSQDRDTPGQLVYPLLQRVVTPLVAKAELLIKLMDPPGQWKNYWCNVRLAVVLLLRPVTTLELGRPKLLLSI